MLILGTRRPKNRSLLVVNEDFEGKRNAKITLYVFSLKEEFLGTRRPKNRSLLVVNEDFEGKRNAKITF
ncbi:MAG: hypothetical protein IKY76_06205 [Alistipes sp.]|nr:hypothetical protein [Alistipes sp.]